MKFGAFVPQGWRLDLADVPAGYAQYEAMRDVGLKLERLGFDSLWLYDHFHTWPVAALEPTFECFTACTALAAVTSRIRIGQMVACNVYRPPALLAKIASTLDVVSNGRLDFGLGAGWYEEELIAYGYRWQKASTRLHQLDEALQVVREMWTSDYAKFEGHHYSVGVGEAHGRDGELHPVKGAINLPRPLQRPRPPIWVGGGGERLTLRIVAKYADYANYGSSPAEERHKNEILDRHCEELGRDPAEIGRTVCVNVVMGDLEPFGQRMRKFLEDRQIDQWRHMITSGSTQEVVDRLAAFAAERVSYLLVYFPDAVWGDSIDRFAAEVMPALAAL